MFSRSTATFVATTPASRAATIAIQSTPPADAALPLDEARLRTRLSDNRFLGPGGGPGRHRYVLTPTRSRAEEERGFAAVSAALGRIAFREVERSSGVLPHTHTGKSGGHSQPRSRSRMKRLTIRSSSEWKLITASLPPGPQHRER